MRAHRPGRVGDDEYDEEFQAQRREKIELYAWRAKNRLPLFTAPAMTKPEQHGEGGHSAEHPAVEQKEDDVSVADRATEKPEQSSQATDTGARQGVPRVPPIAGSKGWRPWMYLDLRSGEAAQAECLDAEQPDDEDLSGAPTAGDD